MKKLTIGLFGFGVVGEGIYQVLSEKQHLGFQIKKIVIKNPEKERNAPAELFTTNAADILNDPEIDLVVELIDNSTEALEIVKNAIRKGKSVVSANKKMIAENHLDLIELSTKHGVSFLYEAAVCGSVPIIRNLEEYFDNDLITHVKGIVNGSTNYILSKMYDENQTYDIALLDAQKNGFAESNPTLDVEGIDAAYKIGIITLHAFGKHIDAHKVVRKGITSLCSADFQYAREKNLVIKLIAKSELNQQGELSSISVFPTFLENTHVLSSTNNEYNGLLVGSTLADEQFLKGKGAGRYPTSSAVLSDISAYRYGYKYEYKKRLNAPNTAIEPPARFYVSFESSLDFDYNIFSEIEEHYISKDRSFVIGSIRDIRQQTTSLLEDQRISVIRFESKN